MGGHPKNKQDSGPDVPDGKASCFTLVGSAVLLVGALVTAIALFMPWGKSDNADDARNYSVLIWNVKYTREGKSWDQSWDTVCPRASNESFCTTIKACRACTIVGPLLASVAILSSVVGQCAVEKAPIQLGVGLGVLAVIVGGITIPLGNMFLGQVQDEIDFARLNSPEMWPIVGTTPAVKIVTDIGSLLLIPGVLVLLVGTVVLVVGLFKYDDAYGKRVKQQNREAQMAMKSGMMQQGQYPQGQYPPQALSPWAAQQRPQTLGQSQPVSPWAAQQTGPAAGDGSAGWGQPQQGYYGQPGQPPQGYGPPGQLQQPPSQQQPQSGAWGQQPQSGALGQQPQNGAWGQQPQSGAWAQQPASGSWGQQPQSGAWPQRPQSGAWGQQQQQQQQQPQQQQQQQPGPWGQQTQSGWGQPQSGAYGGPQSGYSFPVQSGGYGGWGQAAVSQNGAYAPIVVGPSKAGNLPTE